MSKEKIEKIKKNASELKNQAMKTGASVKEAVSHGVQTSKTLVSKAAEAIDKDKIGRGLEATSKGAEVVAKSFEKAAEKLKSLSTKIRNR